MYLRHFLNYLIPSENFKYNIIREIESIYKHNLLTMHRLPEYYYLLFGNNSLL